MERWQTIFYRSLPKAGDGVFIPAGTVHSLGGDVVVFEIQQNSDVTFRLYDWGHVDAKTGQPRELEVDQALACIDFVDGAAGPVTPVVEAETLVERERLFQCEPFQLWRLRGQSPFTVGTARAGMHRGHGTGRAQRRYVRGAERRSVALTGRGRNMYLSSEQYSKSAGNRNTGGAWKWAESS